MLLRAHSCCAACGWRGHEACRPWDVIVRGSTSPGPPASAQEAGQSHIIEAVARAGHCAWQSHTCSCPKMMKSCSPEQGNGDLCGIVMLCGGALSEAPTSCSCMEQRLAAHTKASPDPVLLTCAPTYPGSRPDSFSPFSKPSLCNMVFQNHCGTQTFFSSSKMEAVEDCHRFSLQERKQTPRVTGLPLHSIGCTQSQEPNYDTTSSCG
eukprot:1160294-Pelagomonas_calceolata.AAC.1